MTRKAAIKKKKGESKGVRLSKALAARLCAAVAKASSLTKACEKEKIAYDTARRWLEREHKAMYAHACEERLNTLEEKFFELCERAHEVACDELTGRERLQAVKLEIDTWKWYLSKLKRAKFGEKQTVELTGKDGEKLETKAEFSPALLEELARMQAKMERKVEEESANLADN